MIAFKISLDLWNQIHKMQREEDWNNQNKDTTSYQTVNASGGKQ